MNNNEIKKNKVILVTYGCQMNEYDSELIRSILVKAGFKFVDDETKADVILLNTCSVRDSAERKIQNKVHEIRHQKNGETVKVGILGCMATSQREKLLENKKLRLDFIAGPDSYKRLPEIIEKSTRAPASQGISEKQKICDVTLNKMETYSGIDPLREDGVNAWIAIMRGCDNFCSFCVVPFTRGRERSRSADDILSEAAKAVRQGHPQIILLGQNVNSYKYDAMDFVGLLEKITQIKELRRIRFMSPHPKDFPDRLLEVMSEHKNICKHIHLPLQAGNNRVLKLMNRQYTREQYLDLVRKIRHYLPGLALTTDIIVGFSSESDKEYRETYELMKEVEFDSAFIFKYSPRKDTVAARELKDDVPEEKKTERIVELNHLQKNISLKKNRGLIGGIQEVLVERKGTERSEKDFQGRTGGNKLVIVPGGKYSAGDVISVKIQDATANILKGIAV